PPARTLRAVAATCPGRGKGPRLRSARRRRICRSHPCDPRFLKRTSASGLIASERLGLLPPHVWRGGDLNALSYFVPPNAPCKTSTSIDGESLFSQFPPLEKFGPMKDPHGAGRPPPPTAARV